MLSRLSNGIGAAVSLALLLVAIITAAIAFGGMSKDVARNNVLAADTEARCDIISEDVKVGQERLNQIEKRQEKYNEAIQEVVTLVTAQTVEITNLKFEVQRIVSNDR